MSHPLPFPRKREKGTVRLPLALWEREEGKGKRGKGRGERGEGRGERSGGKGGGYNVFYTEGTLSATPLALCIPSQLMLQ